MFELEKWIRSYFYIFIKLITLKIIWYWHQKRQMSFDILSTCHLEDIILCIGDTSRSEKAGMIQTYGAGKENRRYRQKILKLHYNMLNVIIGEIAHFKRVYGGCVTQIQKEEMLEEDFLEEDSFILRAEDKCKLLRWRWILVLR